MEAEKNDLIYMVGELYVQQRLLRSELQKLRNRMRDEERESDGSQAEQKGSQ